MILGLKHIYYWPNRQKTIVPFHRQCRTCTHKKPVAKLPKALLKAVSGACVWRGDLS